MEINNKVETLISIERTKAQLDEMVLNIDDINSYSDEDKEFLESFKRIYHTGTNQLKIFIDKLDEEGTELDETSIIYYKRILQLGPLAGFLPSLTDKKKYWKDYTDVMGVYGNLGGSSNLFPIWASLNQNMPIDVYNKTPDFLRAVIEQQTATIDSVVSKTFNSAIVNDNTLPFIDKGPQSRLNEEYGDGRNARPHANHMVKDIEMSGDIKSITSKVFTIVENHLGSEDDFRLFKYIKLTNPFVDSNVSTTSKDIVHRGLQKGDEILKIATDIFGSQYDSFDKMAFELLIKGEEKDLAFKLRTVKGQLGSGEEVKVDPIKS